MSAIPKAIVTQGAEFDAVRDLATQYRRIEMTPIVDDDYPMVRNDYERALDQLMEAMKANGRFGPGNRYKMRAS